MNVKSVALTSIILMSLVALYGCSPDDDTATGSPLITGPLAELQGTWTIACYQNSLTEYIDLSYKISGTTISTKQTYYSDPSCTNATYTDEGAYSDLTVGDNLTASGFKEYQITYSAKSYGRTSLTDSNTAILNFLESCGITTWTTGEYTDLLENSCGHRENTTLLNVYKTVGNNLYLGSPFDIASRINFPTGIQTNYIYVRQ